MARLNSFGGVVKDMFYDDIFNALSAYVESNQNKLDSNSYCVERLDEAPLFNSHKEKR